MFSSLTRNLLKALSFIPGTDKTLVGNTPAFAPDFLLKGGISVEKDLCFDIALTAVYVSQQFWQDTDIGNAQIPKAHIPAYRSSTFRGFVSQRSICV